MSEDVRCTCRSAVHSPDDLGCERNRGRGFHSHDGWHWLRLTDGSVAVWPPGGAAHELTADTWASVVASVSAGGEMDLRFYAAKAFHESRGPIAITKSEGRDNE